MILHVLKRMNIEDALSSERGCSMLSHPCALTNNEQFQLKTHAYIRNNACIKGQPNLTAQTFSEWVHQTVACNICTETARRWLHKLGFSHVHHQRGVYFDGHEHEDVVQYRGRFLAATLKELD